MGINEAQGTKLVMLLLLLLQSLCSHCTNLYPDIDTDLARKERLSILIINNMCSRIMT